MPKPVHNLIMISYIRYLASRNQIINIQQTDKGLKIYFANSNKLSLELISSLTDLYKNNISFDLTKDANISVRVKKDILKTTLELVEIIDKINNKLQDV
jgi:transcription-repair coupling factor (superfamily II helicase)